MVASMEAAIYYCQCDQMQNCEGGSCEAIYIITARACSSRYFCFLLLRLVTDSFLSFIFCSCYRFFLKLYSLLLLQVLPHVLLFHESCLRRTDHSKVAQLETQIQALPLVSDNAL